MLTSRKQEYRLAGNGIRIKCLKCQSDSSTILLNPTLSNIYYVVEDTLCDTNNMFFWASPRRLNS